MVYEKPVKTIAEQVSILKDRGLIVEDDSKLERYLNNISYYHLGIYFKHFQDKESNFLKGTKFEDVLNVYIFDQKLRLLLSDILERIEKSFKARLINELSVKEFDGNWINNASYFRDATSREAVAVTEILENLRYSKEIYIKHFYNKYPKSDYPPAWMAIESLTFGQCVLLYRHLSDENKEIIAITYGLNKKFIESWFYSFSDIRNICAHHGRLWNRELRLKVTQKHPKFKDLFFNNNGNRIYNHILLMYFINYNFNPDSDWLNKLEYIITEHNIEASHMGFPEDWIEKIKQLFN